MTEPGGELSRDYRDFYLTPKYGRLSLKVEYCGHRVADDGRPVTKEGKVVEEIALERLNCSSYSLTLDPENPPE